MGMAQQQPGQGDSPLELDGHKRRAGRRMSGDRAQSRQRGLSPSLLASASPEVVDPETRSMQTGPPSAASASRHFQGRHRIPKGLFFRGAPLACERAKPGRYDSADADPPVFRCRLPGRPALLPFRRLFCLPATRRGAGRLPLGGPPAATGARGRTRAGPRQAM